MIEMNGELSIAKRVRSGEAMYSFKNSQNRPFTDPIVTGERCVRPRKPCRCNGDFSIAKRESYCFRAIRYTLKRDFEIQIGRLPFSG